jgi:branched-chain amino acid transport system substrate-binding protein
MKARGSRKTARGPTGFRRALTTFLLFVALGSHVVRTAEADSPTEIVLGMSTVLSGSAEALGKDMERGVLAGLERENRTVGSKSRRLRLIALDDGYLPARAALNTRQLIEKEDVLAIIGNVGTPTAMSSTSAPATTRKRKPLSTRSSTLVE